MKFAPRVAVSVALVSVLCSSVNWTAAGAAEPSGSQESSRPTIDSRLGQLETRVKMAQTEGRLTTEEADNYKSAIGQIAEAEASYLSVSGKLGPAMNARLHAAINKLEKTFDTTQHDRKVAIANLPVAESLVETLINQARQDNRLTEAEAAQLHDQLSAVVDMKTNLSRDGVFNYGDTLVVSMHLDRVVEHLGKLLDDQKFDAPSADAIAAEVSTTLASDKIAAEKSTALRKEYDDLVAQVAKLKDIANPDVKAQQTLALASQLELLKNKVDLAVAGKLVAVPPQERHKQVDQSLAASLVSGQLSPAEAHEMAAELQGTLADLAPNTSLSDEKTLRAALELERIAGNINRWSHPLSQDWPGLDAFQTSFAQAVDAALAANRITAEQAASYKDAAAKLATTEAEYKSSNGALDGKEALELAMQIEQLRVQLHRQAKDRDIAAPDIAGLQKELDKLIADGVEAGKVRGVTRWNERLHQIEELKANFEKSATGLDDRAKLEIAVILAEAIADVQAQLHRDQPYEMSLDLRLDQLGDRISNAVATGVLPVERGTQYRAGVDTILNQLWSARRSDGGLTANESLIVATDVNLIAGQLEQELRDLAMPAREVTQKLSDLQVRIGKAVSNGRLTVAQANGLITELDRQTAAINNAATNGGGVSHGEGLKFAYDAHRLATQFETMLHSDPVPVTDVAHRAMVLDNRLANALAAGQLTVPQAQQFKTALERVLSSSAQYRDSDAGMSYPEALALAIELDSLGGWMERGIRKDTANRDVDSREGDIQRRIKDLVSGGKLTQKDADALRVELDRIEESEAAFRVSEEGLNYAEALTLTLDLDRLSARVDSLSKSASNIQPRKQQ